MPVHGAHQIELKLGEIAIFSFISHQSHVRACFKELHKNIRLAENTFKQLGKVLDKLC